MSKQTYLLRNNMTKMLRDKRNVDPQRHSDKTERTEKQRKTEHYDYRTGNRPRRNKYPTTEKR